MIRNTESHFGLEQVYRDREMVGISADGGKTILKCWCLMDQVER